VSIGTGPEMAAFADALRHVLDRDAAAARRPAMRPEPVAPGGS
jgi:hypothetical protein